MAISWSNNAQNAIIMFAWNAFQLNKNDKQKIGHTRGENRKYERRHVATLISKEAKVLEDGFIIQVEK